MAALLACGAFAVGLLIAGLDEGLASGFVVITASTVAVAVVVGRLYRIVVR